MAPAIYFIGRPHNRLHIRREADFGVGRCAIDGRKLAVLPEHGHNPVYFLKSCRNFAGQRRFNPRRIDFNFIIGAEDLAFDYLLR